jgi:hypothetical protein
MTKFKMNSYTTKLAADTICLSGWLGLISNRASEEPERAGMPRYKLIGQSEGPQGSEILPRRGKMSVPVRNKTRHPAVSYRRVPRLLWGAGPAYVTIILCFGICH